MCCEESELWITYHQNSRGSKTATTQLIELEFQSHKLNDLEDVLDHVFSQGWVDARYRSLSWWEKRDGTKVKNGTRVDTLLKEGVGKCESSALRLVIADCSPVLWISYVFLKSPNAHAAVQRVNLNDAADPCGKLERLAHVTNYVFRKGFLPANARSRVHWEDACKKHIEEHVSVQHVLCERGVGKDEDKPLRLVIGWDPALAEFVKPDADTDFGFNLKTTHPVSVEQLDITGRTFSTVILPQVQKSASVSALPSTASRSFQTSASTTSLSFQSFSPTTLLSFQTHSPSTPVSFTIVDSDQSRQNFHLIFFGAILFLSWTAIMYPRVYGCVCEQCRVQ